MASPQMRMRSEQQPAERERKAGLRLLGAERSEEIFPLLLEEIIALGHRAAFVARVDFETSSIAPIASLNCSRGYLQKQRTTLFAMENPIVRILHTFKPETIPGKPKATTERFTCIRCVYRNRNACWEAERSNAGSCLAVENFHCKRRLNLPDQVCGTCDMRAYAAVVCVELKPAAKAVRHLATGVAD